MDFAIIENGVVVNVVVWDGDTENWTPPENQTAERIEEGVEACIGYKFEGGTFIAPPTPPISKEEILANNTSTRTYLLNLALSEISPLQYAVDLDMATTQEKDLLLLWKKYSVAVNRVDLNKESPDWPIAPV